MATKLMKHQERAIEKSLRKRKLAIFHKMGRGKTLTALATLAMAYADGLITDAVVFAPAYLKRVWSAEIERHFADDLKAGTIRYVLVNGTTFNPAPEDFDGLTIYIASIESMSYEKTLKSFQALMRRKNYAVVVDEATAIKTPSAKRTRNIIRAGTGSRLRLALTGTPITNGLENLYAIFRFLDPAIIGVKTFTAFKARYCVMGGYENHQIVGYKNRDELLNRVMRYADVQETDPADFPDRVQERIPVDLTKEQISHLDDLKRGFLFLDPDQPEAITTALTYLLRAQQIIGGDFAELKKSPKHEVLLELLQGISDPVIIWHRFRGELARSQALIKEKLGIDCATFSGDLSESEKAEQSAAFVNGDYPIMLTTYAGARGQTWINAPYAIFLSRSFSYEDNEQAMARNWGRIGQEGRKQAVTYYDLVANHPLDEIVFNNLKKKHEIATAVIDYLKGGK